MMDSPNNGGGERAISERICRAVLVLERSRESSSTSNASSTTSQGQKQSRETTPNKRKQALLERERQALHEVRDLLAGWEMPAGRVQRHELARAISALFQCLDHREQSLRFIADQTLDAVFQKLVLKFQPDKVVAFLLNELNKKTNPARAICGALQKLSWIVGKARAQKAGTFLAHFLASITLCLQRPEESIQVGVDRHFPSILAQLGPSVVDESHTEKAEELFGKALANLDLPGAANRAACTVIANLAKFVPFILHKSFYQLSTIVLESDGREHKMRVTGALNTFRMNWTQLTEQLTENTLNMLRKVLCKVLCFLHSPTNELLVAALELLRECAQHCADSKMHIFNFNPMNIHWLDNLRTSSFDHSFAEEEKNTREKSAEAGERFKRDGDDQESVYSATGTSSKMSVWSSMGDLIAVGGGGDITPRSVAEFGMEDLDTALRRIGIEMGDEDGQGGNKEGEDVDEEDDEDDKFSVISAELFVDPLMNCFHQQKAKMEENGGEGRTTPQGQQTPPMRGEMEEPVTPCHGEAEVKAENANGNDQKVVMAELAAIGMANSANESFWLHGALLVASRFLLASRGQLRDETEVRTSHKILAMEVVGTAVLLEPKLATNPLVFDEEGHHHSSLNALYGYIGHDDDALAISTLNFAFNVEKWKMIGGGDQHQSHVKENIEKGKLVWHLKRTLHWQRSPSRLKSVFHLFAQSIPLLCAPEDDGQLLAAACEYAISSKDCDYFLVKTARAEFLSQIRWSACSAQARRQLQPECLRVFLQQLFDPDPRVHRATLNALPRLISNAQLGPRSAPFSSFVLPQCFDHCSSPHRLPLLLGLSPHYFNFSSPNSSNEHLTLSQNLAHLLNALHSIAFSNFSECHSGFALTMAILVEHFPPTMGKFGQVWLTSFGQIPAQFVKTKSSALRQSGHLPCGHKLLSLLLECAGCNCTTLNVLTALLKSITALFAGICESLLMDHFGRGKQQQDSGNRAESGAEQAAIPLLWGIAANRNEQQQKCLPSNPIEQYTLLLLRVLNLYYSIVAEERAQRNERSALATVSSEGFVGGAATILARPSLLFHSKNTAAASSDLPGDDFDCSSGPSSSSHHHSSKVSSIFIIYPLISPSPLQIWAATFSLLVGSGIRPSRPSSFTHSATLRSFESPLRGAYKSFTDHLNPESFSRFLAPLEMSMDGLCTLLEVSSLSFIRPFLDELLLYQRMLMDISPIKSARMIHQLLKSLFNANATNLNGTTVRQNQIWDQQIIPTKNPLEMHLYGPLNNFTVFTAFVGRAEFADAFVAGLAGWMLPHRLRHNNPPQNSPVIGELLHQFEPFITHLLKMYSFTNSVDTKKSILDCVCSLCVCNVRYELLDRNGKFRSRVLAQIKQLSLTEDAPLLPTIFAFLCVLARIHFMNIIEIENMLMELFNRIDHKNCHFLMEAMQNVLLELFFNAGTRKCKYPEEHSRTLSRLKGLLTTEFALTFRMAPAATARCWIILLSEFRQNNEELWVDASQELFSLFANYNSINSAQSQTPLSSPTRESVPNSAITPDPFDRIPHDDGENVCGDVSGQLFLSTILLSVCSPTVFRPIDEFFGCVQSLLHQFAAPLDPPLPSGTEFLQIPLKIGPFLFILLNHMDEEVFLMRLSTMFGEGKTERRDEAVEFIGRNVAGLMIDSIRRIYSDKNVLLKFLSPTNGGCALLDFEQPTTLFLLFTLHQCLRAAKSPKMIAALTGNLLHRSGEINLPQLASVSPSVFAFWASLLTMLDSDIPLLSSDHFLRLPCHCQALLTNLILHKLCENESPSKPLPNALQNSCSNLGPEFGVKLMAMEDEKMFKRVLDRLPQDNIQRLISQMAQLIRMDRHMDSILPRFVILLAKSENSRDAELVSGMLEISDFRRQQELLMDYLHDESSTDPPRKAPGTIKFSSRELAQLSSNSISTVQFYRILASHATSDSEFRQLCSGLCILNKDQIGDILQKIIAKWPIRRQFFRQLFDFLEEENGTIPNTEMIIDAVVNYEFNSLFSANTVSCTDEKVFVLARLEEFLGRSEKRIEIREDSIEKLINQAFVRDLLERLMEHRPLHVDYFKAIKFFFSHQTVANFYATNDLHTLRSLQHFLSTLWDYVEKDIARWERLHIDQRRHWAVSVQNVAETEEEPELEQQLLKMFGTVQRIVFAAKKGLIRGEAEGTFRAILRLSLLQRMALVPEAALRLDWPLVINANGQNGGSSRISIPLVQIHMLNDPEVLADFCWHALWLGWQCRAQFEELWMSLFGVLSFTPTTPGELQHKAAAESSSAVARQLVASGMAIDGLTNLLLQTLLYPNPGNPVESHFIAKNRRRRENYLFLDSEFGELALTAKLLTTKLAGKRVKDTNELFIQNLEANPEKGYCIGQTSLYHLWSISGLLEIDSTGKLQKSISKISREITSDYLLAQSAELDISSSVRALFDTFMHWLGQTELDQLPMPILNSTLRSLSLLSDLFHDPAFYRQTFIALRPLVGAQKAILDEHPARGLVIALLLKCASVLDWATLNDSGETSTAKFLESLLLDQGLRSPRSPQFIRQCSLHGLLYLLQSLHLDLLCPLIAECADFLVTELRRMQRMTDILTDFQPDSMEYNKLVWATMFFIVEEALPIDHQLIENFLRILSDSFVDPRVPTWQKELLIGGMESLVLHSCSYAPRFRRLALECFETYQLQPAHLPFALSLYLICIYRELQEGGEFAYALNKAFPTDDFHKLLNVFSFYASSASAPQLAEPIVRLTADLICSIWSKESVLECVWTLLIPPLSTPTTPKNAFASFKMPSSESAHPLEHPLQLTEDEKGTIVIGTSIHSKNRSSAVALVAPSLNLSPLDQCLLHLLHLVFSKLYSSQHRVCMELASNFLFPKLALLGPSPLSKCHTLLLLCSANGSGEMQRRASFLLHSADPTGTRFFSVAFPAPFIQILVHSFIGECESVQLDGLNRAEMEGTLNRLLGD